MVLKIMGLIFGKNTFTTDFFLWLINGLQSADDKYSAWLDLNPILTEGVQRLCEESELTLSRPE